MSDEPGSSAEGTQGAPLPDAIRRRGRWLAVVSHPFSMVFRTALLRDLATQALVTLGAAEAVVGLHASLAPFMTLLQLPALRAMDRFGKRRLLLITQLVALLGALPLLWFSDLLELGSGPSSAIALAALTVTALALTVGSTAWWPLLHGFVTPGRTSRFFGVLRTWWHVALIGFFLFSTWWLHGHPGGFGLLFGVAWACGLARVLLLLWFPERGEPTRDRLGAAFRSLWSQAGMRRYLIGVTLDEIVVRCVPPFAIVLLRREIGLSEAETLALTLAYYVAGLVALYPAGRLADRLGARPVLLVVCLLKAGLIVGLALATQLPGEQVLWTMTALFFGYSLLSAGFGVSEIKILFRIAPAEAPSSLIVATVVVRSVVAALAPLAAGATLQLLQGAGVAALSTYQGLFFVAAAVQGLAAAVWIKKL